MLPPDSSAARMPFFGAISVAAMSSRSAKVFLAMDSSSFKERTESRVACSTLIRARRRLFSTVLSSRKLPSTVAAAME